MRKRMEVKQGTRFGMLTIIKEVEPYYYNGHPYRQFLCQCDCGKTSITTLGRLRIGMTKSCGCKSGSRPNHKELTNSRIYNIWRSMKQRCYDSNAISFPNYGGRGISVCDEWRNDFMAFYNWSIANGYADNLTIDRIDSKGNYEPSNCRWVTYKQQANNTSSNVLVTHNGESHTLAMWGEILGIQPQTLNYRINHAKWSIEKAFTTPVKIYKRN